jgi:trimeric autotransporter adhesin
MLARIRPSLVLMALATSLVACSKSSSSGDEEIPIPDEDPVSIEILPPTPRVEAGGADTQLSIKAIYSNKAVEYVNATGTRGDVAWSSTPGTDGGVATLSASGSATGVTLGTVEVGATYGNQSATRTLTVTPRLLALQVFPYVIRVDKGSSAPYSLIALFEDHTATQVEPDGVTVDATTVATASKTAVSGSAFGSTTLSVTYHGRSVVTDVEVTPPLAVLDSAVFGPDKLALGTTGTYAATLLLADFTEQDVTGDATWTSSNEDVATVAGGVVTPVAGGTTTITATLEGTEVGSVDLTVQTATVVLESLEIVPTFVGFDHKLPLDATTSFKAIGHFTGSYDQDLTDQVAWDVVNASEDDADLHAFPGDNPGYVTSSNGTNVITYLPGDVVVTAQFGGSDAASNNAEYPLTIGGLLSSLSVSVAGGPGTQGQFTATGHYVDDSGPMAFTSDLTERVSWFDGLTEDGLPTFVVIDNTPGSRGAALLLGPGSTTVTAYFHGFTVDLDAEELVPLEVSGSMPFSP